MEAATECATIKGVKEAYERMGWLRNPLSEDKSTTATELVKGGRLVGVSGAYDPERPKFALEPITLPEPRLLTDYTTAPCKHECGIYKQIRHAKQANRLLTTLNPTKQALLRATASQCGLDSAHCHSSIVKDVTNLDRPGGIDGGSREAALFCAATLHRFGLPVDYARLKTETLPESSACCNAPLWDRAIPGTRMDKVVAWQCHLGRCKVSNRNSPMRPEQLEKEAEEAALQLALHLSRAEAHRTRLAGS